jgi:hypothetical protein
MDIYLDGLGRSGNIFLTFAINLFFENNIISERTHNISSLKKYKNGSCFIVPVRDALPYFVSNVIYIDYVISKKMFKTSKKSINDLDELIFNHINYFQYLVSNEHFFIAPFHEFTKDHISVCNVISTEYPQLDKKTEKGTKEQIFKKAESQNKYFYHPHLGNAPREEVSYKKETQDMIQNKYKKELDIMQENINKLYDRYYKIKNKHNL